MMPAAAGWGERHNMRTLISITTGVRFPGALTTYPSYNAKLLILSVSRFVRIGIPFKTQGIIRNARGSSPRCPQHFNSIKQQLETNKKIVDYGQQHTKSET